MPHPIKNPTGLAARGGPQIVLERPELAKFIGAIAAEWGEVDQILKEIFSLVSLAKPIPEGAHLRSEMADAIFDCLTPIHTRKEVILAAMRLRRSEGLCKEFDQLARRISRATSARNKLIHASWQICDDYPDDLLQIVNQRWVRYTVKDAKEILKNATYIRNQANDFLIKVAHAPKNEVD